MLAAIGIAAGLWICWRVPRPASDVEVSVPGLEDQTSALVSRISQEVVHSVVVERSGPTVGPAVQ